MKKRIVSFLMALVMTVSLLPVSAFAVEDVASSDVPAGAEQAVQSAEAQQNEDLNYPVVQGSGIYNVSFATQEQIGTVAFSGENYPLFLIKIDNSYTEAVIEANTGTLVEKAFPQAIWWSDAATNDVFQDLVGKSLSIQNSDDDTYFSSAKSYYAAKKSDITMNEGVTLSSENGSLLLFRLKGSGRGFKLANGGAFVVIEWAASGGSEEPKDITISFGTDGLPTGSYTKTITNTIKANGNSISTTYLVDANAGDNITFVNATGGMLMKGKIHYLNAPSTTGWPSGGEKKLSDLPADASVSAADLKAAGFPENSFAPNCTYYFFANTKHGYGILLQMKASVAADKTALNTETAKVTGENAANWYQSNDRYNGKTASKTGFWAEMQPALTQAKAVADNVSATQTAIDNATAALSAAIANLIPATQLNATELYEAVQKYSGTSENSSYSEKSLKSKTTATVNAFKAARSDAEDYLAKLFDENGATDENKAANQSKADGYITALKEAAEGLVDKVNAYTQPDFDNAVSGIRLYSKLYDPEKLTESDYTAESWRAYKATYEAAQAALKNAPFFNTEMPGTAVNEITKAFSDFRNACHGLVENKSQITVTISLTDKYAVQKNATASLPSPAA